MRKILLLGGQIWNDKDCKELCDSILFKDEDDEKAEDGGSGWYHHVPREIVESLTKEKDGRAKSEQDQAEKDQMIFYLKEGIGIFTCLRGTDLYRGMAGLPLEEETARITDTVIRRVKETGRDYLEGLKILMEKIKAVRKEKPVCVLITEYEAVPPVLKNQKTMERLVREIFAGIYFEGDETSAGAAGEGRMRGPLVKEVAICPVPGRDALKKSYDALAEHMKVPLSYARTLELAYAIAVWEEEKAETEKRLQANKDYQEQGPGKKLKQILLEGKPQPIDETKAKQQIAEKRKMIKKCSAELKTLKEQQLAGMPVLTALSAQQTG